MKWLFIRLHEAIANRGLTDLWYTRHRRTPVRNEATNIHATGFSQPSSFVKLCFAYLDAYRTGLIASASGLNQRGGGRDQSSPYRYSTHSWTCCRLPGQELLLLGTLKGAVLFIDDLARAFHLPLEIDYMAVASYGSSTESSGIVCIMKDLEAPINKKHVLIVEDIVDSGQTLHYLGVVRE